MSDERLPALMFTGAYVPTSLAEMESLDFEVYKKVSLKNKLSKKDFCVRLQTYSDGNNVTIPPEKVKNALADLADCGYLRSYYMVCHCPDGVEPHYSKVTHYHLVLCFHGRQSIGKVTQLITQAVIDYDASPYLRKKGTNECLIDPAIMVDCCNSVHSSVRYLMHLDNPEKGIYPPSWVVTNDDDCLLKYISLDTQLSVAGLENLLRLNNWNYCQALRCLDLTTANRARNILKDLVEDHRKEGLRKAYEERI